MKICILIDEFVSGAAPILAVQEALCLKKLGHDTQILVGTRFARRTEAELSSDVPIRFLTDSYPTFARKLNFRFPFFSFFSPQHLFSAIFAPSVISNGDFDVIIAHGLFSGLIAYNVRRARKIPFFTIFWDPSSYILPKVYSKTLLAPFFFFMLPLTRLVDKWAARAPDRLILGSRFHFDWFKNAGVKNIEVVYPGCAPLQTIPQTRGDFVLAVDRWDIGSQPDILLDALKRSKNKFALKIVGGWHNDAMKIKFEKKVADYGLSNFVELVGKVSFEKLQVLFTTARCFAHPTMEAFGMAALEAASCGCPIIIPSGSGVTDLFIHGKHGLFLKDKDSPDEYLSCIEKFVSDRSYAHLIGRQAWEVARTYTWDHHAERLDSIVKGFLKR